MQTALRAAIAGGEPAGFVAACVVPAAIKPGSVQGDSLQALVDLIARGMVVFEADAAASAAGCAALSAVLAGADDDDQVANRGPLKAVLEALAAHNSQVSMHEKALGAVALLCRGNASAQAAAALGAIEKVIDSALKFKGSDGVQAKARRGKQTSNMSCLSLITAPSLLRCY